MKTFGIILVVFGAFCLCGPSLCCVTAGLVSGFLGADMNLGSPVQTLLFGHDIGEVLYNLSMMPVLLFFTAPIGFVCFLLGLARLFGAPE